MKAAALFLAIASAGPAAAQGLYPQSPDLEHAAGRAVADWKEATFGFGDLAGGVLRVVARPGAGAGEEEAAEAVRAALREAGARLAPPGASDAGGVRIEVGVVGGSEVERLRLVPLGWDAPSDPPPTIVVAFARKPWVRGPLPALGEAVSARGSSGLETDPGVAACEALREATSRLADLLGEEGIDARRAARVLGRWEAPRLLADRVVLREGRGDGALYRAHAWARLSPKGREELRAEMRGELRDARRRVLRRAGFLAGIGAATFLAYLWVDFATRGRRTPWVRVAAIAVFVGAAAVVV